MTTKEQERKALEKIKELIAGLGEDSYLSYAFAGCVEDAERNIDEDACYSMQDRFERADAESDYYQRQFKRATDELESKKSIIEELSNRVNEMKKEIMELREDAVAARKDITIATTDGDHVCKPFAKLEFFNNDGFRFVNVVENSGWTNSYRINDLKTLVVE